MVARNHYHKRNRPNVPQICFLVRTGRSFCGFHSGLGDFVCKHSKSLSLANLQDEKCCRTTKVSIFLFFLLPANRIKRTKWPLLKKLYRIQHWICKTVCIGLLNSIELDKNVFFDYFCDINCEINGCYKLIRELNIPYVPRTRKDPETRTLLDVSNLQKPSKCFLDQYSILLSKNSQLSLKMY